MLALEASAEDSWAWAGYGMDTCANTLALETSLLDKAILGQWVWGFWSGLNSEKVLNGESYRSLSIFRDELQAAEAILNECRARPNDQIAVAAMAVYERLGLASLE
jgi:hypothetical protein